MSTISPSKPSSRKVMAAVPPARLAPTITYRCGIAFLSLSSVSCKLLSSPTPRGRPPISAAVLSILALIYVLGNRVCLGDIHVNHPIFHAYGKADQPAAFRVDPPSAQRVKFPQVSGTGQRASLQVSLTERRGPMRAAVQVGLNLIFYVHQQYFDASNIDSYHLSDPEVIERHDLIPLHRSNPSPKYCSYPLRLLPAGPRDAGRRP